VKTPFVLRLAFFLFRLSLRTFPPSFQRRFGPEAEATFQELAVLRYRRRGALGTAWLLLGAVADNLRVALQEPRSRNMPHLAPTQEALTMGSMLQDIRLALRMLLRRPGFTAVAVLTLALGIGCNTAIYSVLHGVLLSPLPLPEPDRLVRLYPSRAAEDSAAKPASLRGTFSLPDFRDWERESATLEAAGLFTTVPSGPLYTAGEAPMEVPAAYVTAGFFEALGRQPYLGRTLRREEELGDNRVVMLSHGFWKRALGGDSAVVGRTVQLDDEPFVVAGVMPPDFSYPDRQTEIWMFLTVIPEQSIPLDLRQVRFLEAVGRLRSGASLQDAEAELSRIAASLESAHPDTNAGLSAAQLEPLATSITGSVSRQLLLLLGTSGLLLLLACANVAHLLLARGVERRQEMAVRAALGAGRERLLRQMLTESTVLSALGGVAGVGLAFLLLEVLRPVSVATLPRAGEVALNAPVLAFAVGVTLVTGLLFGALPALRVIRRRTPLTAACNRISARGRRMNLLIVGEAAAALLLVLGAALLGRSLWELQRVDPGFDAERLLAVNLTINDARYPDRPGYMAMYRQLLESLGAVPGVEGVGSIRYLPLRRTGETLPFTLPDRPEPPATEIPEGQMLPVSPGFFRVAGVPLLEGRDFSTEDIPRAGGEGAQPPLVAIVNDALVRRYWPGEATAGREIVAYGSPVRIIGRVADVKQAGLDREAPPTIYLHQEQVPRRGMAFLLRAEGNPVDLVRSAQAAVWRVDPEQPIQEITTMEGLLADATTQPRLLAFLLSAFAVLALVLAAVGIYGVLAHAVRRRTHEIGVRVALGAHRGEVLGLILRQGMTPIVAGIALGLGVAVFLGLFLADFLRGVVFGVAPVDLPTYLAVVAFFTLVALLACYLPGRAALRIDPVRALREE
jgi:predicted permease